MDSFPDSSEELLNDLDPLSRALLDLSMQRGMDDSEIAEVLGTDQDSVLEVRVGLLRNLAERVAPEQAEADLPELEAAVAAQLYPAEGMGVEAETEANSEIEAEAVPTPAAAVPPAEPARKRRLLVLVPLLLVLAVVVALIAAGIGSDEDGGLTSLPGEQPQPPQPRIPDESEQGAEPTRLAAVGAGKATGSATVTGDKVKLTVDGLQKGATYRVWLYNSVIDAKALGQLRDGRATFALPANAKKYRYLDVSLEPRDGNPNHSGQSVLRVPVRKLQS